MRCSRSASASIWPSSTIWTIFSSIVLPIPDRSFARPVERELRDRAAGLAHALRRAAVGERAELVAAFELEEVGQELELVGHVCVARERFRHHRDDMDRARRHLPAHVQRAREPRADGARARRRSGSRGCEVLVIDDGSPDGTGEIADRLAAELPWVHVLHRERKEGLGPAYLAGFRRALELGADLVFEMDCDFSHDPADVPRLAAAAEEADLVLGSRYVRGRRHAQLGARAALHLARRLALRAGAAPARDPRPDRRVQVLPAGGAGDDRPRRDRLARATRSRSRRRTGRSAPASASSRCRSRSPTARSAARR